MAASGRRPRLAVAAALLLAALASAAAQCSIPGCGTCASSTACAKCDRGYVSSGWGLCNCAPGYAGSGNVCVKCGAGTSSAGGPIASAKCLQAAKDVPLPAAKMAVTLAYDNTGMRYFLPVNFGSNGQPSSLVVDTGSGSLHTCAFNADTSTTSKITGPQGVMGYGAAPVTFKFVTDTISVPGTAMNGIALMNATVTQYPWIGDSGFLPSCVATNPQVAGGLIGLSPSGGLTGGRGNFNNQTDVGGAACFPAGYNLSNPGNGDLVPCNNTPQALQAIFNTYKWPAAFGLTLERAIAGQNLDNAGQLHLGGISTTALRATSGSVTTPLTPNLWRNDFYNGSNNYVFWQFVPLSIDLEYVDGTTANLCDTATAGGMTAPGACTVIADTGYDNIIVNNNVSRATLFDATYVFSGPGALCGARLLVTLPTNPTGTTSAVIAFNLTNDGSNVCGDAITTPAIFSTPENLVISPPPEKFWQMGVLPLNWWVFGQPLLQQLYPQFDFTSFGGVGAIHFAKLNPPKPKSVTVAVMLQASAPQNTSLTWPANTAITNHMITVGNSNGLPLQHTVDSGSGILMKSCAGAPTCSQQIGDIFAPSTWWDCMTQPTCGYNVSNFSMVPSALYDGSLTGQSGAGSCNFSQILEPSGAQTVGPVAVDSAWLYNTNPSTRAASGRPLVTIGTAYVGCTWARAEIIGDTNDPSFTGCDLPGSPTAASCSENKAAEAGHDRSLGSIPTMLFNNKAISYDAWSICQYPQGPSSQQACSRKATRNSFVTYGNAVPRSPRVALQSVPMLTMGELQPMAAELSWNTYTQSRMLTRYLIRVANITIGGGSNASSIAYVGARGIANLDTGAFAALQIGPVPYQVWNQMTTANIAAAAGGPWTVTACTSEGSAVCGAASNANPDGTTSCLQIVLAKGNRAQAMKAAAYLQNLFAPISLTFDNGATASVTPAQAFISCTNNMIVGCSYPSGSNPGIPTPLWLSNTWFNDRYTQFDRAANLVRFSAQGVNACAGGFRTVA